MEKKTYYVSVHGRSVLDDPQVTSYEWVIMAAPEEVDSISHKLELLGEKKRAPSSPIRTHGRTAQRIRSIAAIRVYLMIYTVKFTDLVRRRLDSYYSV
ncbi:hypothetical protein RE628_23240 [Paenibacillus sp. D2_2]|uniref:hypothetical protein n=1 Tax=Paenibacillus sp. D2_2 TaxID=3073092 RepID=UPI002815AF13|nr:hypothetical protein [Paenibacillus sp. D2_2]WMT40163.1 hypothetical protein RE628_23240 [Paenibacillus sp. D2_2]